MVKNPVLKVGLRRDELERNLGGGLPVDSLVLIEGEDGTGKSILAQRLVYSLLKSKHKVTYISTEMNTKGFIDQMASLEYDVKFHIVDNSILFIPMFPFLGKTKLRKDFMKRLFDSPRLFENEIIVIDTLSFLMIGSEVSHEENYLMIDFLKKVNSMNKTIIFCVDPDQINKTFLTLLRSISDVYLSLEMKMFAGNLIRAINVKRFKRCQGMVATPIPYKVEPGKGLAIEIASFS